LRGALGVAFLFLGLMNWVVSLHFVGQFAQGRDGAFALLAAVINLFAGLACIALAERFARP
jgi:hypothetical protein